MVTVFFLVQLSQRAFNPQENHGDSMDLHEFFHDSAILSCTKDGSVKTLTFFTSPISYFWEHLGVICFIPKNQSFLQEKEPARFIGGWTILTGTIVLFGIDLISMHFFNNPPELLKHLK